MAQGTIPGSSLAIGSSSTIDAAGYFSDADGDELSYTGASSNEGVATVAMEGSSATITAVAAGDAVITITASDGEASASQGFTVTVAAAPRNNPPVAVGTIPGSSLAIGGSSTIDAAGYFSDADGDELTYTGSSSNEAVATVAMDGSSATITAVAAGDAVITITASDGSASVSQGFRVDVNAGPKAATVVISRLLDENRNQISDPTGINGTIYAVLDVQSNDETWTEIGLTLNGEAVTPLCRGSASADVSVGPGLAAAGQVEVECRLQTNAVVGECAGMPLMPKYANGEYELGAFLTTDDDATREVVASQPIALKNSNFVTIAHVPGNRSEVGPHTSGLTFYGGPSTAEGNVNTFHACPVAYDGTEVGKMQLGTVVTDTDQNPIADAARATFREGGSGSYYPIKEAPFTWMISTASSRNNNGGVENVPGETEHWIVNDGIITDPNGRDISAKFRAGGEMAKLGPLHFDFKAPAITDNSELVIAAHGAAAADWTSTTAIYYRDSGGNSARRFRITEMSDMGVGHVYGTTSAIAVGDYSAGRNADASPNTAFAPLEGLENVTHIHQLPEEDPNVDGVADGGGIDTYVAELQSLADRLGNGTWLGGGRIRTASTFGVDRTPPVISRQRPAEALVLSGNELFFEIEDPRLETGEDGSQPGATVHAYAGDSRYWVVSRHYWTTRPSTAGGSVTVDVTPDSDRFAREDTHVVYVRALDVAGNATSTSFTFVRDQTDPALTLSAVPSNFGSTTAKSVSVTVAGTLSDATEIRRAFLSIHAGATCAEDSDALASSQVSGPIRRLDNGTNEIEFSEVFTVKQGDDAGATPYCFYLKAEDDARDADDRAAANVYSDMVSTFSVGWPAGPPAPPPGPTFEFTSNEGDATATTNTAVTELEVPEGTTAGYTYWVHLSDEADDPTADAPVNVTITEAPGFTATPKTFDFWDEAASPAVALDSVQVTIGTAHDTDIVSDVGALTHSATGFDDAPLMVKSLDEDFEIMVSPSSINEDDGPVEVTITVNAGDGATIAAADGTATPVSVTLGNGANTTAADVASGSAATASVTVAEKTATTPRTGMAKVMVDAVDDAERFEENESIALTAASTVQGVYVKPASIMIMDDDPDITLSLSQSEVNEDAGTVTVTINALADAPVGELVTLQLAIDATNSTATTGTDFVDPGTLPALEINTRQTTGSITVTLTITEDGTGESNETIIFDDATGSTVSGSSKTYTTSNVTLTIVDNDDT